MVGTAARAGAADAAGTLAGPWPEQVTVGEAASLGGMPEVRVGAVVAERGGIKGGGAVAGAAEEGAILPGLFPVRASTATWLVSHPLPPLPLCKPP